MPKKNSALATNQSTLPRGREPSAASGRVLMSLPDGRWLALPQDVLDAALVAGAEHMSAAAPSSSTAVIEPFLTAEQAGLLLGVSARLLEDFARQGIIPHCKFGRFNRFRVSEVAAHCRKQGAAIP